jgi:hypothetical protein
MGAISHFFASDHRRLEELLRTATAQPDRIDLPAFEKFRGGLLRHIGMEEKVLLPAARRARAGSPLPVARRIHLDHGAIASLLVPTPTAALIEKLLSILNPHNLAEEQPGGLYEQCDQLLEGEATHLLERINSYPETRLAPYHDGPHVDKMIENAIDLARQYW